MDVNKTKQLHFLFVDDNRINRKVVAQLLMHMEINVTEAESGKDALELLETETFDLIFMDIVMPGMNGYETTHHIRERGLVDEDTPIIAVTANEADLSMDEALLVGMNGVLTKPLHRDKIEKQLERFFGVEDTTPLIELPTSPVFDRSSFEQSYPESFLRNEIIDSFLSQTQKNQFELHQAFRTELCDVIKKKVKYLKGLFHYLHAKRIVEIMDNLMELCVQDKINDVSKMEDLIVHEYDAVVEDLKEYKKRK